MIQDGCHACSGAIGVYYLQEAAGKIAVTGRWPEAVDGSGWGAAPEWQLTNKFTSYPAIYATGGGGGQGITVAGFTISELRPNKPVTSPVIRTSFSNSGALSDNDERAICDVNGVVANVHKDRSFDVIVTGSISARDRYEKKGERFVPVSRIDWDMPCESS